MSAAAGYNAYASLDEPLVGRSHDVPTEVPSQLGEYALVRLLAQGGMADLFLARTAEGRNAVLKVLAPRRAGDADSCALFRDEAKLMALFDHDNVPRVYALASFGGVPYLAMEYVDGADLREIAHAAMQASAEIPYEAAIGIVIGAAAGLDHAHRRCDANGRPLRLVHRDVSLSNIMVTHDGVVKIIDFGIAQSAQSTVHTAPGVVRGKASYMSPEQCLGERVDLRTDVFALGVVLYEMTTGRRCFRGTTDFARMLAVVRGDFVAPRVAISDYPIELEAIIKTALATDASRRYCSAAAMIEALERVAFAEGWIAGATTISDFMHELFGEVAEPWLASQITAEITASAIVEEQRIRAATGSASGSQPTVITRRRLARGTSCEIVADDDDQPTRGRRSVPKILVPRFAA